MDRILVTGATGQVGGAVTDALIAGGFVVRAATRKTQKLTWTDFVQPVYFDYGDQGVFKAALSDISGLVLIAPPLDANAPARLNPFIDKAEEMRISHVVFISALGSDKDEQVPLRIIERHLMGSGLDYTILRPNFFMENFSTGFIAPMITQGAIYLAAGGGKTSFISVKDISEVAAIAFREKLFGAEYNLTGPEALDYSQAAKIISEVSGRSIVYNAIPEEVMLKQMRDMGMDESSTQYAARLFAIVRDGRASLVIDDARKVTGKTPVSFAEFARQNAAHWGISKAA